MYSLYFKRSTGEKLPVELHVKSPDDVLSLIKNFVHSKNPKFEIHYVRYWGENPVIYDFGSYTEFFYLYKN